MTIKKYEKNRKLVYKSKTYTKLDVLDKFLVHGKELKIQLHPSGKDVTIQVLLECLPLASNNKKYAKLIGNIIETLYNHTKISIGEQLD